MSANNGTLSRTQPSSLTSLSQIWRRSELEEEGRPEATKEPSIDEKLIRCRILCCRSTERTEGEQEATIYINQQRLWRWRRQRCDKGNDNVFDNDNDDGDDDDDDDDDDDEGARKEWRPLVFTSGNRCCSAIRPSTENGLLRMPLSLQLIQLDSFTWCLNPCARGEHFIDARWKYNSTSNSRSEDHVTGTGIRNQIATNETSNYQFKWKYGLTLLNDKLWCGGPSRAAAAVARESRHFPPLPVCVCVCVCVSKRHWVLYLYA